MESFIGIFVVALTISILEASGSNHGSFGSGPSRHFTQQSQSPGSQSEYSGQTQTGTLRRPGQDWASTGHQSNSYNPGSASSLHQNSPSAYPALLSQTKTYDPLNSASSLNQGGAYNGQISQHSNKYSQGYGSQGPARARQEITSASNAEASSAGGFSNQGGIRNGRNTLHLNRYVQGNGNQGPALIQQGIDGANNAEASSSASGFSNLGGISNGQNAFHVSNYPLEYRNYGSTLDQKGFSSASNAEAISSATAGSSNLAGGNNGQDTLFSSSYPLGYGSQGTVLAQHGIASGSNYEAISSAAAGSSNLAGVNNGQDRWFSNSYPIGYGSQSPALALQGIASGSNAEAISSAAAGSSNLAGGNNGQDTLFSSSYPLRYDQGTVLAHQGIASGSNAEAISSAAAGSSNLAGGNNGQDTLFSSSYPLGYESQGPVLAQHEIASGSNSEAISSAAAGSSNLAGVNNGQDRWFSNSYPLGYGSQSPALALQGIASGSNAEAISSAAAGSSNLAGGNNGQDTLFSSSYPLGYDQGTVLAHQGIASGSNAEAISSAAAGSSNLAGGNNGQDTLFSSSYPLGYDQDTVLAHQGIASGSNAEAISSAAAGSSNLAGGNNGQDTLFSSSYPLGYGSQGLVLTQHAITSGSNSEAISNAAAGSSNLAGVNNGQDRWFSSSYPLGYESQSPALALQGIASGSNAEAISIAAAGTSNLAGVNNGQDTFLSSSYPLRYGNQGSALAQQGITSVSNAEAISSAAADLSNLAGISNGQNTFLSSSYPLGYGNQHSALTQQGVTSVSGAEAITSGAAGFSNLPEINIGQDSIPPNSYLPGYGNQGPAIVQQGLTSASNAGATSSTIAIFSNTDEINNGRNTYLYNKYPLAYGRQGPVLTQQETASVSNAQASSTIAAISEPFPPQLQTLKPDAILNSEDSSNIKYPSVLSSHKTKTVHLPFNIKNAHFKVIHRSPQSVDGSTGHSEVSKDALGLLSKISSEFEQVESNPEFFIETDYRSQPISSTSQSKAQATSNSAVGSLDAGNYPYHAKGDVADKPLSTDFTQNTASSSSSASGSVKLNNDGVNSGQNTYLYDKYPLAYKNQGPARTQKEIASVNNAQAASNTAAISDSYPAQLPTSKPDVILNNEDSSNINFISIPLSSHKTKTVRLPLNIKNNHFRVIHRSPQAADGSTVHSGVSKDALGYLSKISSEFEQIESNPKSFTETEYPSQLSQDSTSQSEAQATSNSAVGTVGAGNYLYYGKDGVAGKPLSTGFTQSTASSSSSASGSVNQNGVNNGPLKYRNSGSTLIPEENSGASTNTGFTSQVDTYNGRNPYLLHKYPVEYGSYGPKPTSQGITSTSVAQATSNAAASNQVGTNTYPTGFLSHRLAHAQQVNSVVTDAQTASSTVVSSSKSDAINYGQNDFLPNDFAQGYGHQPTYQGTDTVSDAQASSSSSSGSGQGGYNRPRSYFLNRYYGNHGEPLDQLESSTSTSTSSISQSTARPTTTSENQYKTPDDGSISPDTDNDQDVINNNSKYTPVKDNTGNKIKDQGGVLNTDSDDQFSASEDKTSIDDSNSSATADKDITANSWKRKHNKKNSSNKIDSGLTTDNWQNYESSSNYPNGDDFNSANSNNYQPTTLSPETQTTWYYQPHHTSRHRSFRRRGPNRHNKKPAGTSGSYYPNSEDVTTVSSFSSQEQYGVTQQINPENYGQSSTPTYGQSHNGWSGTTIITPDFTDDNGIVRNDYSSGSNQPTLNPNDSATANGEASGSLDYIDNSAIHRRKHKRKPSDSLVNPNYYGSSDDADTPESSTTLAPQDDQSKNADDQYNVSSNSYAHAEASSDSQSRTKHYGSKRKPGKHSPGESYDNQYEVSSNSHAHAETTSDVKSQSSIKRRPGIKAAQQYLYDNSYDVSSSANTYADASANFHGSNKQPNSFDVSSVSVSKEDVTTVIKKHYVTSKYPTDIDSTSAYPPDIQSSTVFFTTQGAPTTENPSNDLNSSGDSNNRGSTNKYSYEKKKYNKDVLDTTPNYAVEDSNTESQTSITDPSPASDSLESAEDEEDSDAAESAGQKGDKKGITASSLFKLWLSEVSKFKTNTKNCDKSKNGDVSGDPKDKTFKQDDSRSDTKQAPALQSVNKLIDKIFG